MKKSISISVKGRVQGVAFRYYAVHKAIELDLVGWVRNLSDENTVEIYAEGEEKDLMEILDWAHHGPSSAYVTDLNFYWGEAFGKYSGFSVKC